MAKHFKKIRDVVDNLDRLTTSFVFNKLLSRKELQDLIIRLNTEGEPTSQLFEQGIDSLGVSLGEYAATTVEGTSSFQGKKQKGQRFDHITLKDEGKFYKSFKLTFKGEDILEFSANPVKDETNLFDDFGKDVLGITDQNLQILINKLHELVKPIVLENLFA